MATCRSAALAMHTTPWSRPCSRQAWARAMRQATMCATRCSARWPGMIRPCCWMHGPWPGRFSTCSSTPRFHQLSPSSPCSSMPAKPGHARTPSRPVVVGLAPGPANLAGVRPGGLPGRWPSAGVPLADGAVPLASMPCVPCSTVSSTWPARAFAHAPAAGSRPAGEFVEGLPLDIRRDAVLGWRRHQPAPVVGAAAPGPRPGPWRCPGAGPPDPAMCAASPRSAVSWATAACA